MRPGLKEDPHDPQIAYFGCMGNDRKSGAQFVSFLVARIAFHDRHARCGKSTRRR